MDVIWIFFAKSESFAKKDVLTGNLSEKKRKREGFIVFFFPFFYLKLVFDHTHPLEVHVHPQAVSDQHL